MRGVMRCAIITACTVLALVLLRRPLMQALRRADRTLILDIPSVAFAFNDMNATRDGVSLSHLTEYADVDRLVVVSFAGRLGNNMFQLATGIAAATEQNMSLVIEDSTRSRALTAIFPRAAAFATATQVLFLDPRTWASYKSPKSQWFVTQPVVYDPCCIYKPLSQIVPRDRSIILDGLFQSYKYSINISHMIHDVFQFAPDITDSALSALHIISENANAHVNPVVSDTVTEAVTDENLGGAFERREKTARALVGIHVRRGDYIDPRYESRGYIMPPSSYFIRAMEHYTKHLNDPLFVVVSEEIDAVRHEWKSSNVPLTNTVFHTTGTPGGDMCLLTMMDHLILSTGTYGVWCGLLSKGSVVYFRDVAQPGKSYYEQSSYDDMFPPSWIDLSP